LVAGISLSSGATTRVRAAAALEQQTVSFADALTVS